MEDALKITRGTFHVCKKRIMNMGFDEKTAEMLCAQMLIKSGQIDSIDELVDTIKAGEDSEFSNDEFDEEKKKTKTKEEKSEKEKEEERLKKRGHQPKVEIGKSNIKGGMANPVEIPLRPFKSENRLQTKMERLQTEEEKFKTHEELQERATYAQQIKKRDAYFISDAEMGNFNVLNNVIKVPITLAKEMVQEYKIRTIDGIKTIKYFKPYSELQMAISDLKELPIIIEHKNWQPNDVVGLVKNLHDNDTKRSIDGIAFLTESKLSPSILWAVKNKKKFPVSIGFGAHMGAAGTFNGQDYDSIQEGIVLDHLALIIKSIPRCSPDDGCGLNIDAESPETEEDFTFKYEGNYYIDSNDFLLLFSGDIEKKRDKTNLKIDKSEKNMDDGQVPIQGDEPQEFEIIFANLRNFMKGKSVPELTQAVQVIKDTFGDGKMTEEITDLKAEIDALTKKLEDSEKDHSCDKKLLDAYKEKEMTELIDTIKKYEKFEDSDFEGKTIKDLRLMDATAKKFLPSDPKDAFTFPKSPQEKKKKVEDGSRPTINQENIWDDVNSQFPYLQAPRE